MKRASTRTLVLGDSGYGKSYWAKSEVDSRRDGRPVVVWDPTAEWAGPSADRPLSGANVFPTVAALCAGLVRAPLPRVVLQPPRDAEQEFRALCELVFRAGDCVFVVDEAHTFCRMGQVPRELLDVLRMSRHRRVDLYLIGQRPFALAPDIRDQVNRTVLFHMSGGESLAWCDRERARGLGARVLALKPRQFIDWRGAEKSKAGRPT